MIRKAHLSWKLRWTKTRKISAEAVVISKFGDHYNFNYTHSLYWRGKLKLQLYWTKYGTKSFGLFVCSKWSKTKDFETEKGISNGLDIILDEFIKTNHKIVLPILSKRFATLLKMEICQKVGISQS